jgi:ligand-binding SRPBCC domain-containing protein
MEYKFSTQQYLPLTPGQAWDFFSTPLNLPGITPPDLGLRIINPENPDSIYDGMRIDYIVRPVFYIPLKWKTGISGIRPNAEFTDTQLSGPYAKWEHHHQFVPVGDGTLMIDQVTYRVPFGMMGRLLNRLFVRKKIEAIFRYRKETLEKIFPLT